MRKRIARLSVLGLLVIGGWGLSLLSQAQSQTFTIAQQFGEPRPQGVIYDPNFDQFAWVDPKGRLTLADATTYTPRHILYETPDTYNAYAFSNDGRWLALAIDVRVELWDTRSGALVATLEPDGARRVQGPLNFADDDVILQFDTLVPAPQEIRRSENDTVILPWLWDIRAARREAPSTLPNGTRAFALFSYRSGVTLTRNNLLLAGVSGRVLVLDAKEDGLPIIAEIPGNRLENDPIEAWHSAIDPFVYVRDGSGGIARLDTRDGSLSDVPTTNALTARDWGPDLLETRMTTLIGEPLSREDNPLIALLLGDDFWLSNGTSRKSVMLLDILEPLTVPQNEAAFRVYYYDDERESANIDYINPADVAQFALHPDTQKLMVRRASGQQPIEIYDIRSGARIQVIYPRPDHANAQVFTFNADGSEIISGFQRFDTLTGAVIYDNPTQRFSASGRFLFSDDSQNLLVERSGRWEVWNIASGAKVRESVAVPRGQVLDRTPDQANALSTYEEGGETYYEVLNIWSGDTRRFQVPQRSGYQVGEVLPNDDWSRFAVAYLRAETVEYMSYAFDGTRLIHLVADDLPQNSSARWFDADTLLFTGGPVSDDRVYGVEYHVSGLPQCLVDRYPAWERFLPLWESYRLNSQFTLSRLDQLALRICAGLPEDSSQFTDSLTPTPRFTYRGEPPPDTSLIAGVPACLTQTFRNEALQYAEAWRVMTAGLDEAAAAELEDLLCEGLITNVGQIRATPTVNPNTLGAATATPVADVADTVGGGGGTAPYIMLVDTVTGVRNLGRYTPPSPQTRIVSRARTVADEYEDVFNVDDVPGPYQLSPDGRYFAVRSDRGFITVYQLSNPRPQRVVIPRFSLDEPRPAISSRRSVGLAPTATQPFAYVGETRPTLTPTITPTAPPTAAATASAPQLGVVEDVCPARRLFTLDDPPPEFAPSGRLITASDGLNVPWVLEPETGLHYAEPDLPTCHLEGNCDLSPDGRWLLTVVVNDVFVSRPDGSDRRRIVPPLDVANGFGSVTWLSDGNLLLRVDTFQLYDPDESRDVIRYEMIYNPATDTYNNIVLLNERDLPPFAVYDLPTTVITRQPNDGHWALVSTPYNPGEGFGSKYYMLNRMTGEPQYFARTINNDISAQWHPQGDVLYYRLPDNADWFIFDPATEEHRVLGRLPGGIWSPDDRYRAAWLRLDSDSAEERLAQGDLPPKLQNWDSETGLTRHFCLPESGLFSSYGGTDLVWSPDGRYIAFQIDLPLDGDNFAALTPVVTPTPRPTNTPVPLEDQYQAQFTRTLLLDTQTGAVTIIGQDIPPLLTWIAEEAQP